MPRQQAQDQLAVSGNEPYLGPEAKARRRIDEMLIASGWTVQGYRSISLGAARGVAVREFPMAPGHGTVDYLLFLDRKAAGMTRDVGGVRLDLGQQGLVVDGREVDVTSSEFRLLELLAREPERAFTREEIVAHLWRSSYVGGVRTCDVHVKNLRRKIERDPARPERLVSVRGVGYMLRAA